MEQGTIRRFRQLHNDVIPESPKRRGYHGLNFVLRLTDLLPAERSHRVQNGYTGFLRIQREVLRAQLGKGMFRMCLSYIGGEIKT